MRLAVLSFFRNSAGGQAQRYCRQVAALRDSWPGELRMIAVYGDCTDKTQSVLAKECRDYRLDVTLVEANHGKPVFGSVESVERFKALSFIGNIGMEQIDPADDVVWYVESDLIWNSATVLALAGNLKPGVDIVAPLIFAGDCFYDVFAFRGTDGGRFAPFYPYHNTLSHNGVLTPVNSVGSAFAMRGVVGKMCRMINDNVLVGFCEDARNHGYGIFVNSAEKVVHP